MNLLNIFRTPEQIKARKEKKWLKLCLNGIHCGKQFVDLCKNNDLHISDESIELGLLGVFQLPDNKGCRDFCRHFLHRTDYDQLAKDLYLQQNFHTDIYHAK